MSRYTAVVTRDEDAWMVRVPEVDRVTQARTLGEVEVMARDLIDIMTGETDVELAVEVELPDTVRTHLAEASRLRALEAEARSSAAAEVRAAAAELRAAKLSMRDIGTALGVSHQRAAQLLEAS